LTWALTWALTRFFLVLALLVLPGLARAQAQHDRFFVTSDGVRLHWIEAGPPAAPTIVMVPGLAMPAWIFSRQIADFSAQYHVAALDPRGQGASDVAPHGYEPIRRGQDIAELINQVGPQPVVLLGWSLGVLDSLAYVHTHGDARLAGLVLVDNSVGEEPAPRPVRPPRLTRHPPRPPSYETQMALFVRSMFLSYQDPVWLDRLTDAVLRLPEEDEHLLRSYPMPRTYWREAVYSTSRPVLYIVRPGLEGQAANLQIHHADAESVIFNGAGHALFIDQTARFDATVLEWLRLRVWPRRT
jgi:non-heme chloroperoxidase